MASMSPAMCSEPYIANYACAAPASAGQPCANSAEDVVA